MDLINKMSLTEGLKDLFRKESDENPLNMKNLYYYISNLSYILYLDDNEEIVWTIEGDGENERVYTMLFTENDVFDAWRNKPAAYMVINFDQLKQLLQSVYNVNNTPVQANIVYDWDSENNKGLTFKIDIKNIENFEKYVALYNSISTKAYIWGTPANSNPELIEILKKEFAKEKIIKNASYIQVFTPPQDDLSSIEILKPNLSYFAIIYDTFDCEDFSYGECLKIQEKYSALAKEKGVLIAMLHRFSEVGEMPKDDSLFMFYNAEETEIK